MDVEITGADDFLKLSRALKDAGRLELRKELHKGIRDAAKPLIPPLRAAAAEKLPHRGGLAGKVAKSPMRVVVKTGRDPGAQVVVGHRQQGYAKGEIRHPVFADAKTKTRKEWRWVTQRVDPSWFTETLWDNREKVLPGVEAAVERVVDKVVAEVHR